VKQHALHACATHLFDLRDSNLTFFMLMLYSFVHPRWCLLVETCRRSWPGDQSASDNSKQLLYNNTHGCCEKGSTW